MLCVWGRGCDPGRVSDGSRLALYTKLSLSSALLLSSSGMCFVLLFHSFCFLFMLSLELCRCSSDLFLSSRPRTVPDWQPRILLGMVEARSVNVKNTTTIYNLHQYSTLSINI